MQIINTPNYQIIDYSSDFLNSQYDSYCFRPTKLGPEPFEVLDKKNNVGKDKDIFHINDL